MPVTPTLILMLLAGPDWAVEVTDDELTVWSRDNEASGLREVKARMQLDAPPAQVWSVIADVEGHAAFMPHLRESRIVDREPDGAIFLYQRISPPLVDDRDYTVRVTNQSTDGIYKQTWSTANHRGPSVGDAVRLKRVEGAWTVEPDDNGGSWVSYWVHTSCGGAIPRWVANSANRKGIPKLMRALKTRATSYTFAP
ncbi:MAG: SRPBCC family protein [Clostridia bacterium]|nr:SRPBCC family protein [Deltaproteobacteria bacterium]